MDPNTLSTGFNLSTSGASVVDPVFKELSKTINSNNPKYLISGKGPVKPLIEQRQPEYWGLDEQNYYRYTRQSDFDRLGFTPYADNEAIYNAESNPLAEIGRGLQGMALNTVATASDGFESTWDLITGDFKKVFSGDPKAAERYAHINSMYGSTYGGTTEFLANNAINFGFVTGMVAQGFLEGTAATIATGGQVELGGGVWAARIGRGLFGIKSATQIAEAAKTGLNATRTAAALNRLRETAPQWLKSTASGVGGVVLPNITEYIDDAFRTAQIGEALPGVTKGAGAFFRDAQLMKFALTESQLEGGFVENDIYQRAVQEYYDKHGYYPDDATLERIREAAKEGGNRAVMANLPVIYFTDAIVFKPLMSMGKTTSRIFGGKGAAKAKLAERGIEETSSGLYSKIGKKGFFKDAARNTYRYATSARFGRNVLLPGISEGLQENFQGIVSESYVNYYSEMLKNPLNIPLEDLKGTFSGIFEAGNLIFDPNITPHSKNALTNQFTEEGFQTFLSGAFIGGLTGVGGNAIAKLAKMSTAKGRAEIAKQKAEQDELSNEIVRVLNEGKADVFSLFNPRLRSLHDTNNLLKEWQEAKQSGDVKKQKDLLEELRFNHLMTVLQTGQMKSFVQKVESLNTLDDEGIVEATGIADPKEARERVSATIDYARQLESKYDAVEKEYDNPFITDQYDPSSESYDRVRLNHFAYEQAKRDLIFLSDANDKTKERLNDLKGNISKRNASGNTSSLDLDVMTSEESLDQEIQMLEKEVFAEATTPEQKQLIKEKRARKKNLISYRVALKKYKKSISGKNQTNESEEAGQRRIDAAENFREAYARLVNSLAKPGKVVNQSDVEQDAEELLDVIGLNRDASAIVGALNNLNNPARLTEYALRNSAAIADVVLNKRLLLEQSLKTFKNNIRNNQIINDVYSTGFFLDVENLENYIKKGVMPTEIFRVRDRKKFSIDAPEAEQAKEVLESYKPLIDVIADQQQETKPTETPTTAVAPEVATEFDEVEDAPVVTESTKKYQYNDLPKGAKDIVDEMFRAANARRRADGEQQLGSVIQFTLLPNVQQRIKEFFDSNKTQVPTSATASDAFRDFKQSFDTATTEDQLDDIEIMISSDLNLTDEEVKQLSSIAKTRREQLGITDVPAGRKQDMTEQESSAVDESLKENQNFNDRARKAVAEALESNPEDLNDDFFDNIDEC
jgi:hypothetical protein